MEEGYRKGTIHASRPPEGRSAAYYMSMFDLADTKELEGKTILYLCARAENRFAEDLKRRGVNVTVAALSPDYADPVIGEIARQKSPEGMLLAGLGQVLPFRDETFDTVMAFHVYEHLRSDEESIRMFSEISRVLKPSGVAKIGPLEIMHVGSSEEKLKSMVDLSDAAKYHTTVTLEYVPTHIPMVSTKYDSGHRATIRLSLIVLRKEAVTAA